MRFAFYTCDVLTETRFGGNQLAVLPEAGGLSDVQMQQIAREFNYSETTFVLPAEQGHTRRVRIFTPTTELPFAGHPNIGTAFVLASTGRLGEVGGSAEVTFEEGAGLVRITIERRQSGLWCELVAPQPLSFGAEVPPELVARAVSISDEDITSTTHAPVVASVGFPFVMVELRDVSVLERLRQNLGGFEAISSQGVLPFVHLYVRMDSSDFDVRCRMFAPLDGVPEDPATGSANCALAGLLSHLNSASDGSFSYRISQGVEMGRPSTLEARAEKKGGSVVGTWIGGSSVLVTEGTIHT